MTSECQQKLEQQLRESEEKFRNLAENANLLIVIVQGTRLIYANPLFVMISKYSMDELLAMEIGEIIHPDFREMVLDRSRRRQLGEEVESHYEFKMVAKDGGELWLDFSAARATYFGEPAVIGTAFDETQRKVGEQNLRESEEMFRLLAENANAVIGIIQGKNFVYVNPYLEEVSEYTREELLKIDLAQMLHPEYRQMVLERAMKRQMGLEVPSKYQFIMITKSGTERWMDFCAARIFYKGKPGIVGIAVDVTESKQFEQKLTRLKDDLENKNKELESIIGIVSHDLRSPLVNIKGFAEEVKKDCGDLRDVLAKESLNEKARKIIDPIVTESLPESLGFIETSTVSMSRLIESLIQVARVGIAVVKAEKLDTNLLVAEVISGFEFKIKQKHIEVEIEELPQCTADKTQATQIITNLIDNAIKYLDPSRPGKIRVSGKVKEGKATYCVEDNGIGIPSDKQEKIFEFFFRLETGLAGGEGIGLAMVKRMAQRNGGRVCLDSEPGKGSRFFVELPV